MSPVGVLPGPDPELDGAPSTGCPAGRGPAIFGYVGRILGPAPDVHHSSIDLNRRGERS